MQDDNNREGSIEESQSDSLENTRRGFLGATAGAGIAGKLFGLAEDDSLMPQNMDNDLENSVAAEEELADQAGVFDITEYGAVGDGETENTEAIQEAVNAAGEWGDDPDMGGTVLIPPGDFRTFTTHIWHKHNGVTVTGVGYASKLKALFLPADHPRDNDGTVGDAYRIFENNPSFADGLHPDDYEISPLKNFTVQNLQMEGVKDEYYEYFGERDLYSGHGFYTDPDGTLAKSIVLRNLWTHNFDTAGVTVDQADVMINGFRSWNNDSHGLNIDAPGFHVTANNVIAWDNGGYGIDIGAGRPVVSNFHVYENEYGLKSSTAEDWGGAVGMFINGKVERNNSKGFQLTGVADRLYMDNVEFRENGHEAMDVHQGGELYLGQVASIQDNQANEAHAAISISEPDEGEPMKVVADKLHVEGATGDGVTVEGESCEFRANHLESVGNTGVGLEQDDGTVVVHDGRFEGNAGTGIVLEGGSRSVVKTARLADDVGVDIQSGAGLVTLRDLDGRESSTPIQVADGVNPTIENVAGFVTHANGRTTFDSDDYDKTYTVEHGLSVAPERVDVTPDASSDATQIVGVKNLSEETFEFVFRNTPRGGSSDEENVAVFWEASAY